MAKQKSRSKARKRRHQRGRRNIYGTPKKPRLNVFKSLSEIYVQIIDDFAGHTLVAASTIDSELRDDMDGLTKSEQAALVGKAVAERALEEGIEEVVFDRGGYKYIGRIKTLAEAAREHGLKF
ncbi:MAG: 50S ribosomal protein L18 [Anaerolineales bacterium]